jgi:hypothetical protein
MVLSCLWEWVLFFFLLAFLFSFDIFGLMHSYATPRFFYLQLDRIKRRMAVYGNTFEMILNVTDCDLDFKFLLKVAFSPGTCAVDNLDKILTHLHKYFLQQTPSTMT